VLTQALINIYRRKVNTDTDIEPNLFREITKMMHEAVGEGIAESSAPVVDLDDAFRDALRHSNEVFSAFKVHRMGKDMAAQLLDSNGNLKPFEQWVKDIQGITTHQCGAWLQTEYDTAVIRAHQAADWQQFEAERDVLPNLKWMPSTSVNPGADHRPFWGTIRPIDDKFWKEHRPGDRWNCKCSLSSTDEDPTPVPDGVIGSDPQRGLTGNPGKDKAVFSQDHPYFPKSCESCPFSSKSISAKLKYVFSNKKRNCYHCKNANVAIKKVQEEKGDITEQLHKLTTAKGKEAGRIAKEIVEQYAFVPVDKKKYKNIFQPKGGVNYTTKNGDMEIVRILEAAEKLAVKYRKVFIMPNPNSTRSCDFILQDKGFFYKGYDLKSIIGDDSVANRFHESIGQTNRVILNLKTRYKIDQLAEEIQDYFQYNKDAAEVMVLNKKTIVSVLRKHTVANNFKTMFAKQIRQ